MHPIPKPTDPFGAFAGRSLTLGDAIDAISQWFFLPGDWLIFGLSARAAPVAELLELSPADYGGAFSAGASAIAWLATAAVLGVAYTAIRDFDEALTRRIADAYEDGRRRIRIAWQLTLYRWRRHTEPKPRVEPTLELSEEIVLTALELRVLRACAGVQPGYALGVADIASLHKLRKHDAQRVLARLRQLSLVSTTIGGHDGDNAYTLTPAGRALLVFRQIAPAPGPNAGAVAAGG